MRLFLVTTTWLWLAGCGLKGPLYLPPPDPESTPAETKQTETDQRGRIGGAETAPSPAIN